MLVPEDRKAFTLSMEQPSIKQCTADAMEAFLSSLSAQQLALLNAAQQESPPPAAQSPATPEPQKHSAAEEPELSPSTSAVIPRPDDVVDISLLGASRTASGVLEHHVAVVIGSKMTVVKHRYRDFVKLHSALSPILGRHLPTLPPSPTPALGASKSVQDNRKKQLVQYLRDAHACRPEAPPPVLRRFLGLPEASEVDTSSAAGSSLTPRVRTWRHLLQEHQLSMAPKEEYDRWQVCVPDSTLGLIPRLPPLRPTCPPSVPPAHPPYPTTRAHPPNHNSCQPTMPTHPS